MIGLTGPPDDHNTQFHSLVKASKVTVKFGAATGGSYDIGKDALIIISDLKTVFYSSVYRALEIGGVTFAAQGESNLSPTSP